MLRFVVIVLALLAAAAPAAARPVVHTAPAFPSTNGRDAAAWVDANGLHVSYDDGRQLTHPAPSGDCRLGAVSSTEAGFLCLPVPEALNGGMRAPATVALVGLADGAVRLPASKPLADFTSDAASWGVSYYLDGLGDDVMKISGVEDHVGDFKAWFRTDTAQRLDLSHPPAGSVVDLDAPGGLQRVCAPAPTVRTPVPTYVAPWILTANDGRVGLRHCGSRLTRLVGRIPKGQTADAVLTRRYAAWAADDEHVAIRMLATARTYRVRVPSVWSLAATEHRLFVSPSYYSRDRPQVIAIP